jgi:AraC-like DNA-binding protein
MLSAPGGQGMNVDAPLLDHHRIFQSRDTEETRAFLQGKDFRLEVAPRHADALDVRINAVYLARTTVDYLRYGPPIALRAGPARQDYWVQIPLRGNLEITSGRDSLVCGSGHAAVASPVRGNDYLLRADAGCARLRLSLSKVALMGLLGALLGELPSAPLEFAPDMDLASGYGRSFARYVLAAAEDLDQPDSILSSPIAIASFEQFIMTGLLLLHQHSYAQALRRFDAYLAPRDVRRAIDYMECHSDAPFTIGDLVNATGVAGRTLFKHFKDFKGVPPMRYVRNVRFDRVRQALLSAEPEASITEIALSWGFVHMGRFSVEYRRRFGESPSQTLARRRSPFRPLEKQRELVAIRTRCASSRTSSKRSL